MILFVETIYWEDNLMPLKVNIDYQDFDLFPEFQKLCDSLTMQSFYECQQQKHIELSVLLAA